MTPYNWNFPYSWPRKPVLAANVVATTQPLAAQAGLRMMLAGGNAVDAILATAITLTLVEPVSNGIGSDLFAILWDGKELHGINASGRSPAAWTPEYFAAQYPGQKTMPTRGWNTVTVPGCVSAWHMLSKRFGKLPFEKLFEPAIGYGRNGFLVSPTIARQWAIQAKELHVQPGYAEAFMPNGRPPTAGEIFTFPDHAATLEKIAATKGEVFYRGEIAEKLAAHSAKNGGVMKASDLAAHQSDWTPPMEVGYRGYTIHELPPNGQGIVALIALGILEQFDVASLPVDSADSLHLQIEAVKLAFADARRFRRRPRLDGHQAPDDAQPRLPQVAREAHRHEEGAGLRPRHAAQGRHRLPHRGGRVGHDGLAHPVELHGLRLGRRGAGHRRVAAEPRRLLRAHPRAPQPGRAEKSAPTTPSSPASSPRTASRS